MSLFLTAFRLSHKRTQDVQNRDTQSQSPLQAYPHLDSPALPAPQVTVSLGRLRLTAGLE